MPDTPANSTTTKSILVDGPVVVDSLELLGDHDWVRIELIAGQEILIAVDGITLEDSYLTIRDASGNALFVNDDSGLGLDSRLVFTASSTGTYYIDVSAFGDDYIGSYQLAVTTYVAPPVADLATIATHLADGYWNGDNHHFAVTQGGSISVNLTALPPDALALARLALQLWSDIFGVGFTEVATGGQITFDDNEEGAFAERTRSGDNTTSAHVNVSSQWLLDYGNTVGTYAFQTYIHEIGHALGLGHGGFYNGDGSYAGDAIFANDGWPTTVMSYFDQDENSYFNDLNFMSANVLTPMLADIRAMAMLYGLSTTTRTGDTVYGIGNNSGRDVFTVTSTASRPKPHTIVDSGGIDTLNYSTYGGEQIIDLNADSFSNIGGGVGNVAIGYGTIIENAIGGTGDDVLVGNAANNVLNGGNHMLGDTVSYATATAGVTVSLGVTGAQNTIGAGIDTLIGIENIRGSDFDDTLTGGPAFGHVRAGAGNDILIASPFGNTLFGDVGDDTFFGGPGSDTINGGDGFDTIDYSGLTAGVNSQSGFGGAD
ncbi:MAG TPA: M10 family metallopeptidase C-terminal domain-containing protein, partial [Sphingomicrobium sp.]|nr:M10 family metallopeptidase C-terminal domain-containing protein [Sphingomicrobium sp.]